MIEQQMDDVALWERVAQANYKPEHYWQPHTQAILETLLSHIGNPEGKSIIEVGCGSGLMSLALAERGARSALLDMAPGALGTAINAFRGAGLDTPEHFCTDALGSDLPFERYDVVWNAGVIEHFTDEDKLLLLSNMLRMSKPGGIVFVLVPNAWCWQFQLAQTVMKWRGTWRYGHEDDMSPKRLLRACQPLEREAQIAAAYAFDPVAGWLWVPGIRRVIRRLGWDTVEKHLKRSWQGWASIVVLRKKG